MKKGEKREKKKKESYCCRSQILRAINARTQKGRGTLNTLVQHISELEKWNVILLQELDFKKELFSQEELEASLRAQIGDEPEMSVGHGHHHSLPVDGCHSLVCFVTAGIVDWSKSRGGVHLLLCSPSELGERRQFRAVSGGGLEAGRS